MKQRSNKKICIKTILVGVGAVLMCSIFTVAASAQNRKTQTARVEIGQYGYAPATVTLRRGIPAKITFLRTTDDTCATEVLFPDYGIRRELPLNQPIVISLTPKTAGEFSFTCGMNMQRGKVIVR